MRLTLRTALGLAALALLAIATLNAARANHYILPCQDDCRNPRWVLTGSLVTARTWHTATLLPNGKVLVAGGRGGNGTEVLASAELYDPASETWSVTGSLSVPRSGHTATLLPNGQVLVIGGRDYGEGPLPPTAELYDPLTGTWTPTGTPSTPRSGASATLLQSGKVLVAGGVDNAYQVLGSAELYDPETGIWSATGSLPIASYSHTATRLQDGSVLVARGSNDVDLTETLPTAQLYDPVSGEWSVVSYTLWGSILHSSTLLPNGKVLIAGGSAGGIGGNLVLAVAELFDPATQTWTRAGDLSMPRYSHAVTLLPGGGVLATGGTVQFGRYPNLRYAILASTERFDPNTATWSSDADLNTARTGHTATLLPDGHVLIVGGTSDTGYGEIILSSAEIYGAGTP
jgi:Galactose oxidase, central domain